LSVYVVDASVAIKWYVPEVHSEIAACLLDGTHELIAPDLLLPEFGNIVWKKVQRGQISVETSRRIIQEFKAVTLQTYPSEPLLENAVDMAIALGRTVYDCFYNALSTSTYVNNLLWVENIR
jgi:predicted nucleic acid-binding protein